MTALVHDNPAPRRSIALTISVVLHALLLLFFFLYKIITPIPPTFETEGAGGGSGTELALGLDLMGSGDDQGNSAPAKAEPPPPPMPDENTPLTSEVDDDNPPVKAPEKPVEKPKDTKKPPTKPAQPTKEQQEQAFKNKLNNLWNTPGNGSAGHGTDNVPGGAGVPNGTPGGTGIGNGTGVYIGPGTRIDLPGYMVKKRPEIKDKPSVGGIVVMDIYVSADGVVLRAQQNVPKSTTLDRSLVEIAQRACMATTFFPNPKASGEQHGTIRFTFELQ